MGRRTSLKTGFMKQRAKLVQWRTSLSSALGGYSERDKCWCMSTSGLHREVTRTSPDPWGRLALFPGGDRALCDSPHQRLHQGERGPYERAMMLSTANCVHLRLCKFPDSPAPPPVTLDRPFLRPCLCFCSGALEHRPEKATHSLLAPLQT